MDTNAITDGIIGGAINVHRELGPGLLESAYEACLAFELQLRGLCFERQKPLPLVYKGMAVHCGYRIDFVVEKRVIVELKAVTRLDPIFAAQLLTYLRLSGCGIGLLMNFHAPTMVKGIQRFMLGTSETKLPQRPSV